MMPDTGTEIQAIRQRLETMEKQNRRMKQVGVIFLVLIAAVFLMGQAAPSSSGKNWTRQLMRK